MSERGRPTEYTPEIADEVCRRMAGGESLRGICRDDHIPSPSTVRQWAIDDREGFSARYAHARRQQLEYWGDELKDIADDENGDVQRDRLRVDTRKWLLARLHPEYTDKAQHQHTGKDGGPIQVTEVVVNKREANGGGDD